MLPFVDGVTACVSEIDHEQSFWSNVTVEIVSHVWITVVVINLIAYIYCISQILTMERFLVAEVCFRHHLRSLVMSPCDRARVPSYLHFIITLSLSCIIFVSLFCISGLCILPLSVYCQHYLCRWAESEECDNHRTGQQQWCAVYLLWPGHRDGLSLWQGGDIIFSSYLKYSV